MRKEIELKMPVRVEFFEEDELAFHILLSNPTGGANINVAETKVVLENDLSEFIFFDAIFMFYFNDFFVNVKKPI